MVLLWLVIPEKEVLDAGRQLRSQHVQQLGDGENAVRASTVRLSTLSRGTMPNPWMCTEKDPLRCFIDRK